MRWLLLACVAALLVTGLDARKNGKKFKTCPGSKGCKALSAPPKGSQEASTKVLNGFATGAWTQYPYLAALVSEAYLDEAGAGNVPTTAYCTGILINNQWVLTAASCVTDGTPGLNFFLPGAVYLQTRQLAAAGTPQIITTGITTSDVYWSPLFKGLTNDIGLIRLRDKVTGTFSIAPLGAVGTAAALTDNYLLAVAGFGVTSSGQGSTRDPDGNPADSPDSNQVHVGSVAYMKSGSALTYLKLGNTPTRTAMCAGDWGGPALKWNANVDAQQIVGLFISGPFCTVAPSTTNVDGYYTDVTNKDIRDWINYVLGVNSYSPV